MINFFGIIENNNKSVVNIECLKRGEFKINILGNSDYSKVNIKFKPGYGYVVTFPPNVSWTYIIYKLVEGYETELPKVIYLTCKDKSVVPSIVIDNLKNLNKNYEIKLYDDNDCIKFLNNYFSRNLVEMFINIVWGPIKADFWRLCILFIKGGIYYDIDVKPIKPLKNIVEDYNFITCLSCTKDHIFQAFLVANKNNLIIENCIINFYIKYISNINNLSYGLMTGTIDMYNILKQLLGDVKVGVYPKYSIKILEEYIKVDALKSEEFYKNTNKTKYFENTYCPHYNFKDKELKTKMFNKNLDSVLKNDQLILNKTYVKDKKFTVFKSRYNEYDFYSHGW